jgi:hypothetical protein
MVVSVVLGGPAKTSANRVRPAGSRLTRKGDYCSKHLYKWQVKVSSFRQNPGGAQLLDTQGEVAPGIAAGTGPGDCEREPRQVVLPARSV